MYRFATRRIAMTTGNDKATRNIMYEEIVKAGIEFTIYVFLS